jgi:hypothetical protein
MECLRKLGGLVLTALLLGSSSYGFPLVESGVKRTGYEYKLFILKKSDPSICEKLCNLDRSCASWRFVEAGCEGEKPKCYLQYRIGRQRRIPVQLPG